MTDPDKTLEELKAELDAASDVANTAAAAYCDAAAAYCDAAAAYYDAEAANGAAKAAYYDANDAYDVALKLRSQRRPPIRPSKNYYDACDAYEACDAYLEAAYRDALKAQKKTDDWP